MDLLYFDEFRPSFADLPMEIILNIFGYLNPGDRKMAAITCHRWFEASNHPVFQSDVLLKFRKIFLSESTSPISDFLQSSRVFPSIYLDQIDLGPIDNFFNTFGKNIHEITFESIDTTEKQFKSIIKELTQLRSLTIINCSALFMDGQFFESENDKLHLSKALSNITSLSLESNRYLSDAILSRISAMTQNLQHLDLSGCQIAWHNGIHKRFYPSGRSNDPSEAILTFQHIVKVIEAHVRTLEELNLSKTLVSGPALSYLGEIKDLKLRKLVLISCNQITHSGLTSLLRAQTNLVYLDLSSSSLVPGVSLFVITEVLTELQVLKLSRCKMVTNDGVVAVEKLKKLKILDISYCDAVTSDGIVNGIAKTRNEMLNELYLTAIDISEACVIQCAEHLPNLTVLDLGFCFNGVTNLALQIIIKKLIWLRSINLEFCNYITDAALTGMDMSDKLHDYENKSPVQQEGAKCLQDVRLEVFGDKNFGTHRISLRSKAEEDIVQDAKRKQIMFEMCEKSFLNEPNELRIGFPIMQLKGLRSLNLRGCNKISDVSLKYGIRFKELKVLSLSDCQQISFCGIQFLVENCPSIEDLYLSDCHSINDKTIEIITKRLDRLTLLNISGCTQLSDHTLDYIANNCKYLKKLSVYGCRQMCPEPSMRLSTLSSLRTIHMNSNTSAFDSSDTFRIKLHPPPWNF